MKFIQPPKINLKIVQLLFHLLLLLLYFPTNIAAQEKKYTVVLDAGHGGKDPGKIGYKKYKEKNIVLEIVLDIGKILQKEKDIKVIFTRKNDVFVDLWERGRIANKAGADLFISVHCNAHNSQAVGTETWVLGLHANERNFEVAKEENKVILLEENYQEKYKGFDPNSPASIIGLTLEQEENLDRSIVLASMVQKKLKNRLRRIDRGVKQAGFVVLHQTYMPSILVEAGFLTNRKESNYLNSKKGKLEIATSISEAIIEYIGDMKLNTIAPNISKKQEVGSRDFFFKIQISSGRTKLKTESYNFNGLKEVERIKVGNLYKYYYGKAMSYGASKKYLKEAKEKGYKSAFIVAFRGNTKISLSEAIK